MSKEKESLKHVHVELIPENKSVYKMMHKIRKGCHHDIRRAKIALMWQLNIKPDKDGHILLGRCHKVSDMDKELAQWDFVILLNKEVWNDSKFTDKKKIALLDHELMHAAKVENKDGHSKKDERGRYVFRTRKHDVEEFHDIVKRHGIWKRDLEIFAEQLLKRRRKGER